MSIAEIAPKPASIWERYPALLKIPRERFPNHVLIIPDGNRRFAHTQNQPTRYGHKQGFEIAIQLLRDLHELPISVVTLWAFSSDNWDNRKEAERNGLLGLLEQGILAHINELNQRDAKFVHLGRKDRIPESLRKTIAFAEEETAENLGQTVCVAIDFGGQDQELRMLKKVVRAVKFGEIRDESVINEAYATSLRDGDGLIPPADLIIRTSEQRTSDIGWLNGAQTELYFIKGKLFPQVTTDDIVDALLDFSQRQRRLGT